VSGHAESAYGPVLSSLAPESATVVVMMGVANRAEIGAFLITRGWPATTPAAIVMNGSHDDQAAWTGTLAALGEAVVMDASADAAGVLVVGAVVSLAETLAVSPELVADVRAVST
jgi:siroheme synthase